MKAVVWTKYGPPDVLQLRDLEKPVPKDDEVLIRIHATTVTKGDCELRSLNLPIYFALPLRIWIGLRKPKGNTIPGSELAGEIESVGKAVKHFKVGDQVFGATGFAFGANAEYVCLPEEADDMEASFTQKPGNMTYKEAAAVPFGGRDALHFLRLGGIQDGQKILINGAGGSIGTFAVQLAKHFGAEVTAVDSTEKLDMLRAIGADHVVDYTREDFTQNGEVYDVLFDVVGKMSVSRSKFSIKEDGIYLLANPNPSQLIAGIWTRITTSRKMVLQPASGTTKDLIYLKDLIEAGRIETVIDRSFPMEQIVEAHRYVETDRKKGNVVINVVHNGQDGAP